MILNKKGFSLMEMIIVVGVITVLAIAMVAVYNPSSRIDDGNAILRAQASESLAQAIKQVISDNDGLPIEINDIDHNMPTLLVRSGDPGTGTYYCEKLGFDIPKVNIASYIAPSLGGELPIDPALSPASTDTGYYVYRRGNLFSVSSCSGEVNCATCAGDECVGCPVCGNAILEGNEVCDSDLQPTNSCFDDVTEQIYYWGNYQIGNKGGCPEGGVCNATCDICIPGCASQAPGI